MHLMTPIINGTGTLQAFFDLDGVDVCQVHGWQAHHRLICQALGRDDFWYEGPAVLPRIIHQPEELTGEGDNTSSVSFTPPAVFDCRRSLQLDVSTTETCL